MRDFTYDKMTPKLQTYLDWHNQHLDNYDWAKAKELRATLAPGELDAYYQAKVIWACDDPSNASDQVTEEISPSTKYRLVITYHSNGPGLFSYSKGTIYRTGNTEPLATVCRNYGSFPFAWVEGHQKGDFLVCGYDYQGNTVVDLTTGKRVDYLPPEAADGVAFCWADIHPSPQGSLLAVEGCFWACPYEVIIVDFSDPMKMPWPVLCMPSREKQDWGYPDEYGSWVNEDSCILGTTTEVVDLPGHPLYGKAENELNDEQLEELEAYCEEQGVQVKSEATTAGFGLRFQSTTWRRPKP